MTLLTLFISFLKVGLFSIGGGYAAMPLIECEVVTSHAWLSMSEFTDLVTIAEMTPGPIAINSATFVGIRIAGIAGAIVATMGCILPSCVIVSVLAFVYRRYKNLSSMQNILKSLRPAVVALIAGAGCSILKLTAFYGENMLFSEINWLALSLFIAAILLLRTKKQNPILIMVLCGVVYTAGYLLSDVV